MILMTEFIILNLHINTYSWLHIYPNIQNIIPQKSHRKLLENVSSIITTLKNVIYAHSFYPPLARERGGVSTILQKGRLKIFFGGGGWGLDGKGVVNFCGEVRVFRVSNYKFTSQLQFDYLH